MKMIEPNDLNFVEREIISQLKPDLICIFLLRLLQQKSRKDYSFVGEIQKQMPEGTPYILTANKELVQSKLFWLEANGLVTLSPFCEKGNKFKITERGKNWCGLLEWVMTRV